MKFLKEFDVSNKKVLLRVDFNVDIQDGQVVDDFRVRACLPTIKYLLENKAKITLMSHLGEPDGLDDNLRLLPVRERLQVLLKQPVLMAKDCIGADVEAMAEKIPAGAILLLENLRFHKKEKENNENFARSLARLGDIYINDAFGVCHREHASLSAITKFIPSCAGLLLEKEISVLEKAMTDPDHPLVVVMGGTKISTKIKLVKNFLGIADNILLGGALANTMLHARGLAIGKSVFEQGMIEEAKNIEITDNKLHLPVDTVVSEGTNGKEEIRIAPVGKTGEKELILDIGPETVDLFSQIISEAKMIIWNGPMGLFETEQFSHGTKAIIQAIVCSQAYSIAGGGETIVYLNKTGLAEKFSHVSTGGGAMLKFLAGEKLAGIQALNYES